MPPSSPPPSYRPLSRRLIAAFGVGLLALIGFLAVDAAFRHRPPPVTVPIPADLGRLDPQVRAYVTEKVHWVQEAPQEARREATLGLVYAVNGLWKEARLAFENAARLKPREPLAQLYVGVATQELGELVAAQDIFRQVAGRFPEFAPGYYRLGAALLRGGLVGEAGGAFERLIALAPSEWRGYAGLGDVRLRQGRFADAAQLLEQALKIDPGATEAHHLLGLAYRGLGRTNEAQRELGLGTDAKIYPMPDAWSNMAWQHMRSLPDQFTMAADYARLGMPERGVALLETAREYHPGNPSVMHALAEAYVNAGHPDKARALLLEQVQTDPQDVSAYVQLSTCCSTLGLTNDALEFARRAVALGSNTVAPHLAAANAWLAMTNDAAALAELNLAARLDPKSARIHDQIGDVLLRNLDRPTEALQQFQQAAALDPTSVAALVRVADACLRLKRAEEARQAIAAARALAPNEPVIRVLEQRLEKVAVQP
ncbi:MAG: tetratricopeptide repeat protein [Verrucomicrobia bacterium]|nr:tetratricopeptide repeat protein [Verrucomicrobiota bacterium]